MWLGGLRGGVVGLGGCWGFVLLGVCCVKGKENVYYRSENGSVVIYVS